VTDGAEEIHHEHYLELHDDRGLKLTHGWADVIAVWPSEGRVTIIDWKFYRSELPEEYPLLQGGALAAMAMQQWFMPRADVSFYLPFERREYCVQITDLEKTVEQIRWVIERTEDRRMVLQPSAHCRYCPALAWCPAAQREMDLRLVPREVTSDEALERVRLAPPELIFKSIEQAKLAAAVAEAVQSRAKALLHAGMVDEATAGYYLQEKAGRRLVKPEDLPAVWGVLSERLTKDEILHACNLRLTAAEDLWASRSKNNGLTKTKKEARAELAMLLGELVERGDPSYWLRRRDDERAEIAGTNRDDLDL
jgi:hypothetical protein